MNTAYHVARYLAAAVLVAIIGGLIGWYVFVSREVDATAASDSARGLGSTQSFGGSGGSTYQNNLGGLATGSSTVTTGATGSQAPRLWQVTSAPVAGMGFIATTTRLHFVERATGNILEADASRTQVARVTNTLFPQIYEARFARSGQVLMRAIAENGSITTFLGTVASSTPEQIDVPLALSGVYLAQNIKTIAEKKSGELFFIAPVSGGVNGITTNWQGTAQKKIFASALSGWRAQWLDDGKLYLAQNASDGIVGYAFQLSTTGSMTPILAGLPGLSVLPRTGSSAIIYSTSNNGVVALYAKESASADAVALPLKTVAEKCVWSPWQELIAYCAVPASIDTNMYLRNWYAGITHTQDSWWKIDVSTGTVQELYKIDEKYRLDVIDPTIDAGGAYIAFINNLDKSLWTLKIDK